MLRVGGGSCLRLTGHCQSREGGTSSAGGGLRTSASCDSRAPVWVMLLHLLENLLFVKAEKCEFHSSSVYFLGYVVSAGSIQIDYAHVSAVLKWPNWDFQKQLQQFLRALHKEKCPNNLLFVPAALTTEVLEGANASWPACHPRVQRTCAMLWQCFGRPTLEKDVQSYVRACVPCNQHKSTCQVQRGLLLSLLVPAARGPTLFSGFNPQTNRQTERVNQDLETALSCLTPENPASWSLMLAWVEYYHNLLPSSAMGMSQF